MDRRTFSKTIGAVTIASFVPATLDAKSQDEEFSEWVETIKPRLKSSNKRMGTVEGLYGQYNDSTVENVFAFTEKGDATDGETVDGVLELNFVLERFKKTT